MADYTDKTGDAGRFADGNNESSEASCSEVRLNSILTMCTNNMLAESVFLTGDAGRFVDGNNESFEGSYLLRGTFQPLPDNVY